MNELAVGGNFTMQGLADLLGQNMQVVNFMAKEMGVISKRFDTLETSVTGMQKDLTDLKENEEITYPQQVEIKKAVSRRVYKLLEIPARGLREPEDVRTLHKYSMLFHQRCYREIANKGHLRIPYRSTPKKYFDDALQDIEAWVPRNGVQALKAEVDMEALARRSVQEQGYR